MNKTDKIYVAGHRGLVGSAIWNKLLSRGYSGLIGRTHAELDLTDQQAVELFFAAEKPDCVFLAAAKVGGILANNTYRAQFIYDNLMIQNNVIHAAWRHGVQKLLFLGSTCIYPRQAPQPMPENSLLTSELEYTNEPYAIAKIAGIKLCESYNLQYDTNFLAVMPTNLYGPNDNFDLEKSHVLPALLRKIHLGKCLENGDWNSVRADLNKRPVEGVDGKAGEAEIRDMLRKYGVEEQSDAAGTSHVTVEIWGSGKPMREFLWSEDMADACVYLMEQVNFPQLAQQSCTPDDPGKSPEIKNTHINIGTGEELSIGELALLIKAETGFRGQLRFNTAKPDGTMRKLTDVNKLHQLGWHHRVSIEQGIRKLYHWYMQ